MFHPIDVAVVFIYLFFIGLLGLWQAVRIRTAGDFFAGGRKFNKFLMMMHALGTGTHADDPVGVVGASFQRGYSGIWYTYVYLLATPFYWLIAPLFRRSRYLTTADFFEQRYSPGLGLLYAVMGVLIFAINTGTLLVGTEMITTAVTQGAVPGWAAILAMTVVFVVYGSAGGLLATVIVEGVQGLLIIVMSLLLVPFGLAAVGGFAGLRTSLPADTFNLAANTEITWPWVIAASIAMVIGIVAQPHIMEVCASGKTEFEGRVGFTYGNFVKRICALGWAITGVAVAAMVAQGATAAPAHREEAFGLAIVQLLPVGLTGLMFAAILAAQMSTLSAFMVAGSALMSRNLYQKYFLANLAPEEQEQRTLRFGRFAGLVVVGLGVVFAFMVDGVAEALTWFWGVNATLGVLVWAAVLWRPSNSVGAWLAFTIMSALWTVFGPVGAKIAGAMAAAPAWLGQFGDKGDLHLLLLTYIPAGLAAHYIGSVASDTRWYPSLGGMFAVIAVVVGIGLLFVLPVAGWAVIFSAMVALLVGAQLRDDRDTTEADRFYKLMATPVGREEELAEAGLDVVYAGHSEGHPWELNHPKLVQWGGFAVACVFTLVILGLLVWITGL